jgi:hypothetical protein
LLCVLEIGRSSGNLFIVEDAMVPSEFRSEPGKYVQRGLSWGKGYYHWFWASQTAQVPNDSWDERPSVDAPEDLIGRRNHERRVYDQVGGVLSALVAVGLVLMSRRRFVIPVVSTQTVG